MKIRGLAAFLLLAGAAAAPAPQLAGWWQGALQPAPAITLRLQLHVARGANGVLAASLKSIDQGGALVAASAVRQEGDQVVISFADLRANFTGRLAADGQTLAGQWTQGAGQFPLTFHRASQPPPPLRRPQEPRPPFPYRSEDVTVPSTGGIQLAGTLTLPPGAGPFPAAILIAGSGPQNRDEVVFGHKIFLVLADYLTRRGIAVLRMDKRGIGKSGGNAATATTSDYAQDVEADLNYLEKRPDMDARRIGLIGHSEGGLIAPMVASRRHDVSYVVLMAGPGETGEDLLVSQVQALNAAAGGSPAFVLKAGRQERTVLDLVRSAPDAAAVPATLRAAEARGAIPDGNYQGQMRALASPWFREFLSLDPAPYLQRLRCPVLAMIGSKDVQVPPAENLPRLRAALARDKRAEVVEMPGLNHLFQTASTGLPREYGSMDETIAPEALARIGDWIAKTLRLAR